MPNTTGGNKSRKERKKRTIKPSTVGTQDVTEGNGFYGFVLGFVGGKQVKVLLNDGTKSTVKIPGKFRSKLWIHVQDYVIIKDTFIDGIIGPTHPDWQYVVSSFPSTKVDGETASHNANPMFCDDLESSEDEEVVTKTGKSVLKARDIARKGGKDGRVMICNSEEVDEQQEITFDEE